MKTIIYSSIIILLSVFAGNEAKAQRDSSYNYVVLTKKLPQLKPILLTAEKLKEKDGDRFGEFQVIICGKTIEDITKPEKIDKFRTISDKIGVQLVACGFSLNKFEVDIEKVPSDIKIVENGILYNFELQKKGYLSLGL
ncbi:hypothetical protein C8P64_2157 [Christiangramia gaetbulicola]|uniref:Intracellular sulfur oxidation DsrE/DsrF family protein n=1 Tax=Christiangramia gaetbulicola TaxID=703340 RepID=A0A2T6AIK9_9FLAO|nr:sulfur reduction protein DsrE [Christiangramia gaetbulicola]PTX43627.1 hypothetical protein C8P64_2157 [Christiangramia gaetbulicola]